MRKIIFVVCCLSVIFLSCKKGKEVDPSKAVLTEIATPTQTFKLIYNGNGQLHRAEYYSVVTDNQDKRLKEIIEYTYTGNQTSGFKTYTVNFSTNEPTLTSTTKLIYDNTGKVIGSEYTPTGASMPSLLYKWLYSGDGRPSGFQSTDYNLPDIRYVYGSRWGSLYPAPLETINHNFDIKYSTIPNYFADKQVIRQLYYAFHINFIFIADFFSEFYPIESRVEMRYGSGGGLPGEYPKTITTTQFRYDFLSGIPRQITRRIISESHHQEGQKSESSHSFSAKFSYRFN